MYGNDKNLKAGPSEPILVTQFLTGHLIVGKYRVVSILGKGGMGTVYKVQQIFLNRDYALKTIDGHSVSDTTLQRFQLEATTASSLSHPNLVHVHDFGLLDDNKPYLVMDFINGVTFADLLKRDGPLAIEMVTPLFSQACFGLLAAHDKSIVHRDVKPGNIMLLNGLQMGSAGCVKVVDFGIAKLITRDSGEIQALTRTGEIFGSPLYMSPEQCTGGKVDHRSDIYSLGCVLFEMLTETPPHVGQTALATMMLHGASGKIPTLKQASLGREFPLELEQIVAKMLQRNVEDRYQNIGLVAHDLAGVCGGAGVIADYRPIQKQSAAAPAKLISMPSGQFYFLIMTTVLITAAGAGMVGYLSKQPPTQTSRGIKNAAIDNSNIQAADDRAMNIPHLLHIAVAKQAAENKTAFQNTDGIESTVKIRKNGLKEKQFVFPKYCVGSLFESNSDFTNERNLQEAKDVVNMSADLPVTLVIQGRESSIVFDNPRFFTKIHANEFHGLILNREANLGSVVGLPNQSPNIDEDNLAAIAKIVSTWTNLELLALNDWGGIDQTLIAINQMKHLRYFRMLECTVATPKSADQPFFERLYGLTLNHLEDHNFVNAIFRRLNESGNLQWIAVEDNSISPLDLQYLRHCPRLTYLRLKDRIIDDELIRAIGKIKSLRKIFFKETRLRLSQVQAPELAQLTQIMLTKQAYSASEIQQLSLDPRITFK